MNCKECLHIAVCSRYIATGGANKCKHFFPQRYGRWELVCKNVRKCPSCKKERNTDDQRGWYSCPFCGCIMDLPPITDQTQAALEAMDKNAHGAPIIEAIDAAVPHLIADIERIRQEAESATE